MICLLRHLFENLSCDSFGLFILSGMIDSGKLDVTFDTMFQRHRVMLTRLDIFKHRVAAELRMLMVHLIDQC